MHLRVVGAEKLQYEGDIYGIKANAIDGDVICLDSHADYLTVLKKGEIHFLDKEMNVQKEKVILKEDSILFIENNRAIVFS